MSAGKLTDGFNEYVDAVYPHPLHEHTVQELKRSWMAGAMHIMTLIKQHTETYGDAEDRNLQFWDDITKELGQFGESQGIDMGGRS